MDVKSSSCIACWTAGKDRTGLLAALVLTACGASKEEIVADYARYRFWNLLPWVTERQC